MNIAEIKRINKDIAKLKSKIIRIESEATKTTATISDSPGAVGNISDKVGNKATEIAYLQAEIHRLEAEKCEALNRLPTNTLEGNCLFMRLMHGYRWSKIASIVGGANTPDSIRVMCNRYEW